MNPPPTVPLALMYALGLAVAATSWACARGPDGKLGLCAILFTLITLAYLALTLLTRHNRLWGHVALHAPLFLAASLAGFIPLPSRPRLTEMGGMLYAIIPASALLPIALGAALRALCSLTLFRT